MGRFKNNQYLIDFLLFYFCFCRPAPLPVKLLVYKDCKKNIHRVMKLRADRKNMFNRAGIESPPELAHDEANDDQWLKDNIQTLEVIK